MTPSCRTALLPALLATLLLLAGCASTSDERAEGGDNDEERDERSTLQRIQDELDDGVAANEEQAEADEPADLDDQLMPDAGGGDLPDEGATEQRFDLEVDEVPARTFFRGLVDGTPYNLVVHPDVEGTLSLQLKDVTVPEVMNLVRRVHGYEYERDGDTFIVTPARLQSKIFHVDYLNVNREGSSSTSVSSGEATSTSRSNNDDDGSSNNRRSGSSRPSSRIQTTSESNFWPSLQGTLQTMVGQKEGREVMVDPQAGLVVVRAMPGELRDVRNYLRESQENLQRQVILEAKILEVELSDNFQAGINWAALGSDADGTIAGLQTTLQDGQSTVLDSDGAFDPSSVTQAGSGEAFDFGGLFAIGARTGDFASLIRLLDSQGDVNVLSSPRVSTINNQKAVIKVGSDEFFVTDVSTDNQTNAVGTSNEGIDVELTPFFSGISLDVTPQISRDDMVTLHVHPAVSEVNDQQKNLTIAGEQQSLPLALSSVRESDSIVRAKDGQVVVIGGLMQDESRNSRGQTPLLGDIPLIGRLFQQRERQSRQSELVILLRPILANDGRDWNRVIEGSSDRVQDHMEGQ